MGPRVRHRSDAMRRPGGPRDPWYPPFSPTHKHRGGCLGTSLVTKSVLRKKRKEVSRLIGGATGTVRSNPTLSHILSHSDPPLSLPLLNPSSHSETIERGYPGAPRRPPRELLLRNRNRNRNRTVSILTQTSAGKGDC